MPLLKPARGCAPARLLLALLAPLWPTLGLAQQAPTLEAIQVTGTSLSDVDGPTQGYGAQGSRAAGKTAAPLVETARTVNVITRQQLEDQAVTSVNDALLYTPGAFTGLAGASKRSDVVALRGFHGGDVDNTFFDGMRLQSDPGAYSAMQIDPFFLERLDVLKGPAANLYGHGMPGGMVDMTSKKPQARQQTLLHLYGGSHDTYGLGIDHGGALPDAALGEYRITALTSRSDTQFDVGRRERFALLPQVNLHLGEGTDLLLQAYIQHDPHGDYHGGVPYDLGGRARYGHKVGPSWSDADPDHDVYDRDQRMLSYALSHRFNDQLSFNSRARYTDMDVRLEQVAQYGFADAEQGPRLLRSYYGAKENLQAISTDNNLQYHFRLGPTEHDLLAGLDFQRMRNSVQSFSGEAADMNPFIADHLQGGLTGQPARLPAERHRVEQGGLYIQDQLRWQRWILTLGGRQDFLDRQYRQRGSGTDQRSDHRFSGSASLLYHFANGLAPYYSYSEAFDPSPDVAGDGLVPPPINSQQHEIGLKYQPPASRSLYQLALYDLKQKNVQQRVTVDPPSYAGVGSIRARGLELSANAALTPRLNLIAGYSYNDIQYRNNIQVGDYAFEKGRRPYLAPKQTASLWLQYDFRRGIRAGLGERYVQGADFYTSASQATAASRQHSASYSLTDAFISSDLGQWTPALQGATLKLNAANLFDKHYLSGCFSAQYCYFGDRRQLTATLDYRL